MARWSSGVNVMVVVIAFWTLPCVAIAALIAVSGSSVVYLCPAKTIVRKYGPEESVIATASVSFTPVVISTPNRSSSSATRNKRSDITEDK